MGSKFSKELDKLPVKDLKRFLEVWQQIKTHDWNNLDIVPIKGKKEHYRVRVGRMRLQFFCSENGEYVPTSYRKRDERTYKK